MARRPPRELGWVGLIEWVLSLQATRIVLSLAIIISLVPHDWIHANDAWFLVLFGPELVARTIVACRMESEEGEPDPVEGVGWRWPRGGDLGLLLIDLVALISFLPLHGIIEQSRWLRLFRLTRTVMLLRYWSPLVSDLWSVLRRRERARQLSLMGMTVVAVSFAGAVLLNHATDEVGEDFDGDGVIGDDHDHAFWVRMWWALRQIEDPGNMMSSPHELATLLISVFLTFSGLFLVSFLIGVGTDVVGELMELSRLRSVGLQRHTVLINITPATRGLLEEVMGEYKKLIPEGLTPLTPRWFRELRRNARRKREFVVVGRSEEPPDFLREPEFAPVIYRHNSDDDDEAFLVRADVPLARRVVVLANLGSDDPDDDTVRTLLTIVERLREAAADDDEARTSLIAEILDESNIGAATKAIVRAHERVDAHIIPTERLLALFAACVARRRGADKLLMSMLTSAGHELYSWDYREAEGHGLPAVASSAAEALERLYWRGIARAPSRRVLPVGILMAGPSTKSRAHARVALNPTDETTLAEQGEMFAGFVALAPNMRVTADFADEVAEDPAKTAPSVAAGSFAIPQLVPAAPNALRNVLILGFRPATVNLIEALMSTEPQARILIMVEDERERRRALDAFEGHTNLMRTGLLHGLRGTFAPHPSGEGLVCIPGSAGGRPGGHIRIAVGDWTSSRQLMRLPFDLGTAPEMDTVIMISSERHGSDARTTTALMKLEHLQEHIASHSGTLRSQTIVAELINADLAHRLSRRYTSMGRHDVTVFSMHELRAFFMFQSVVVPNFNLVYGELLAPWGQSFVRLDAVGQREGECSFAQLAARLRTSGQIPIAVELLAADGDRQIFVAQGDPARDDSIDLARLDAVWVIQADRAPAETTAHHATIGVTPPPIGAQA